MSTSGGLEPGLKLPFVQLGSRSNVMSQWLSHYDRLVGLAQVPHQVLRL